MVELEKICISLLQEAEHKFTFGLGFNRNTRKIYWHNGLQKIIIQKPSGAYLIHFEYIRDDYVTLKYILTAMGCSKKEIQNIKYTFIPFYINRNYVWENYVDTTVKDLFLARFDVY